MTNLVAWKMNTFRFNPGNPSMGYQGKCSNCWKPTNASYMLVREDGTPLRALCREHAEIWNMREGIKDIQSGIAKAGRKRPYQRRK